MKTIIIILITICQFAICNLQSLQAQNIGINTIGATPNAKALLDIDAATMSPKAGLLIPRMTTTERNAITSPIPESLLIYNTTTQCFEGYNATTSQWVAFGCIGCQLPGAFTANAASNITATTFSANWTASAGATTYFLDVSTVNTFATFVAGYNNLPVGNVTSYPVTGLACTSTYYYRVRANNTCGTSANSNSITVTTSAATTGTSTFTTSGTFTVPACVTSICIKVWGGGGGSGGHSWTTGGIGVGSGGGGGGGYGYQCFTVTPSTVYTVTVGIGGAGGLQGTTLGGWGNDGLAGGLTEVGSLISATGGGGGQGGHANSGNGTGGAGGGSSATVNTTGASGANGAANADGCGGQGANNAGIGGVVGNGGNIGCTNQSDGLPGQAGEVIITW